MTHNPCYTDYVLKNLTLTVDEDLLLAARKAALDQRTSVNQLVRDYLQYFVEEHDQRRIARKAIEQIFKNTTAEVGLVNWSREDLHER